MKLQAVLDQEIRYLSVGLAAVIFVVSLLSAVGFAYYSMANASNTLLSQMESLVKAYSPSGEYLAIQRESSRILKTWNEFSPIPASAEFFILKRNVMNAGVDNRSVFYNRYERNVSILGSENLIVLKLHYAQFLARWFFMFFSLQIIVAFVLALLVRRSQKRMLGLVNALIDDFKYVHKMIESINGGAKLTPPVWGKELSDEHREYRRNIEKISARAIELIETQLMIGTLKGISENARQVAHDIRSPLSALNMVSSTLVEIPENKRVIVKNAVQRINDIANDLLEKAKPRAVGLIEKQERSHTPPAFFAEAAKRELIFLPKLVESIIQEKRFQYADYQRLRFESDCDYSTGAFVLGDNREFGRLISNLFNNSVEALRDHDGIVKIAIREFADKVQLSVQDNGSGIPSEVLAKLGSPGLTFGKDGTQSGSGLGVFHAKNTIEAFGGTFSVSSREGVGTMVNIQLPRANNSNLVETL